MSILSTLSTTAGQRRFTFLSATKSRKVSRNVRVNWCLLLDGFES